MAGFLATVRRRFVALLLVAATPLFLAAALIAYQNSSLLAERVRQAILAQKMTVQLRQRAFLSEGERLLEALSLAGWLADGDVGACSRALTRLVAVSGERYHSVRVFDAEGRLRCASDLASADLAPGETAAMAQARTSGGFAVGAIVAMQADRPPVLPIALPIRGSPRENAASGMLLAAINESRLLADVDGFMPPLGLHAWVLRPGGAPVGLTASDEAALPTEAALAELMPSDQLVQAIARDGRPFVYLLGELPAGMRLLLGQPATVSLNAADLALGRRVVELGLVLLAGLAAVAFGADFTVGRPLKRVAVAVARWRAGGRFEPGSLRGAPAEVAGLARSFAEATAALGVREQQLREAAARQELLMQEIHHRVKNNLQVVASLLNLQAGRIRQPAARAEFHAARDRIRALATLHRHLYAHGELHTINMRSFLEELCHQLMLAMGETPAGGRIALTIEASELRISSDQAVPMALLVTEAVSNAVKYAFPGGRSGHIAVRLTTTTDQGREVALLSIEDDGVGIPAGRAETEAGTRDGLGLQLIRGFARQLGATLEVRQDHGTHYLVELVLQQERPDRAPELGAKPGDNIVMPGLDPGISSR